MADLDTVDGWFLENTIRNIFTSDRQNDVPYMVSYAGAEIGANTPLIAQVLAEMSQVQQSNICVDVMTQVPAGVAWSIEDPLICPRGDPTPTG